MADPTQNGQQKQQSSASNRPHDRFDDEWESFEQMDRISFTLLAYLGTPLQGAKWIIDIIDNVIDQPMHDYLL
jgi:hypothetical protein